MCVAAIGATLYCIATALQCIVRTALTNHNTATARHIQHSTSINGELKIFLTSLKTLTLSYLKIFNLDLCSFNLDLCGFNLGLCGFNLGLCESTFSHKPRLVLTLICVT
jgi:hypothetical protein